MKNLNRISTGLLWGIPTLGRPVCMEWALSFKGINPPINFNIIHSVIKGQEVGVARNALAKQAIEHNCKYIFFHGDDTVPPIHALKQLIFRMENQPNCGVVGGVYCSKCEPAAPLVFKGNGGGSYWDWKVGEFFECTGLGMDCTLIRTEIFERITEPWFKTVDTDKYLDGINGAEQWTEDLYFCRKVLEETEYKIYCDTSVLCDHWDVYGGKVYRLPKDSYPMRQLLVPSGRPKALIVGPKIEITENHEVIWLTPDEDPSADYRGQIGQLPFDDKSFDWVIITQPQDGYAWNKHYDEEWKRVAKSRVSINLHEGINREYWAKIAGGVVDGSFVNIELAQ